jgi:CHAT domain-containing protein/Tfp pilus assembly protein PilF
MLLSYALGVLLPCGCAREEASVAREAPKAAAVGALPRDPNQSALERELGQAERWRKAGDAVREVDFLLKAGARQIKMGRKGDALGTFERALSRSRASGNRPGEAEALLNVGWLLVETNEPEKARRVLEEALRVAEQLGDAGRQAKILHLLGNGYSKLGRYAEALSSYEKSLELARSAGEEGLALAADIWNAMGIVHGYRGEIEKAQSCHENALELAPKAPRVTEAAIRSSFGWIQRRRGELNEALDSLKKALEINLAEHDKRGTAAVLNLLGGVYLDLGENEKAREKYEEALAIHRSLGNNDGVGWALCNIGLVHLAEGRTREALERFEKAREPSLKGEQPRLKAAVLHGIGTALLELGRTGAAVQALEEALPLRRVGGDRRGEAATRLALGSAFQARGELDRAALLIREALDLAREAEASFVQAASLFALAKLDRERGRLEEALTRIERAIGILESVRADLPGDRLKSSFFASKRSYYDFHLDLLMRLERRHPGQGYAAEALKVSERARARSLLDLLAEGRHEVTRGIDPALRQQESEMAAWLSQIQGELIEELSKESPKKEKVETLRNRQTQVEEGMQELERKIRAKHPRYAEVRYPSPLDLDAIQKRLDRDTALLEYALGEDASYLFLVTQGGLEVRELPRIREIEHHVRRVRDGVKAPGRLGGYLGSAYWLHEKLMAPVRSELNGKRLLLIVPDGPLHFLSFEALLTRNQGGDPSGLPYLIRDFALGYVPSMSILSLLQRPGGPTPRDSNGALKLVAFADPVYGPEKAEAGASRGVARGGERAALDGLSQVERLKGSGLEVRRIADRYRSNEVKIYRGEEANEGNVKDNRLVATAERLHFATHGFIDEDRPALSALRLTRTSRDDGLLQVHEIFNLNLEADLVVLSACETGLGEQVTGEGLIGLTRAFLYAGSPSVMVSLWRVSDDKAPDLMADFYQELDRFGDKAEALRQAKLARIGERQSSHPYFWAPFILVGSPE